MTFNLLIAPDSFKGSLTAAEACEAIARGAERAARSFSEQLSIDTCPISDGGEGFAECVRLATLGRTEISAVHGPTGESVNAAWAWSGRGARTASLPQSPVRTLLSRAAMALLPGPIAPGVGLRNVAVLDCASVIGLPQVPESQRDPENLTSYGVGELITIALERGADTIIIGLGGSATCDGGLGMATALGARFEFIRRDIGRVPAARDLSQIRSIDNRSILSHLRVTRIIAACDVINPLYGPDGAAFVYAPQKGASPEQVVRLDEGLRHLAHKCDAAGIANKPDAPGAGAAGGLGFALSAFCRAELRSGVELMLELSRFQKRADRADLVITGEGRFDAQSLSGKACIGVARQAQSAQAPAVALVGMVGDGWEKALTKNGGPFDSIQAISPRDMPPEEAIDRAPELLEAAAHRLITRRLSRG